jgi:hypothetical protein
MIARLMADEASTGLCVTPNARVTGRISGRRRQIDVLIEARHDTDFSRRVIVDAKQKKRKIDVKEVEAFRGMMDDVEATHGYLICPSGHTKAAERRAQSAVSICLVPLDRILDFNPETWPRCARSGCRDGSIFWDGYPEISLDLVEVAGEQNGTPIRKAFVHSVGKCDRCGRFHVHCETCDQLLYVPEDDADDTGHQCGCRLPWFWLASIESDGSGRRSAELHLVTGMGRVETVDRRSL